MNIGVPKEIKNFEGRVSLVPGSVRELVHNGHRVMIQKDAGKGSGFTDEDYITAGARIVDTAEEIFEQNDLVVKVKEPQAQEWKMLREGQTLFTYLHLAPDPEQTKGLLESGCTAIAYETVTDDKRGLPLLSPMSEVAGRMSIQAGAHCLEAAQGGKGVLLGGVPGVSPANVVVIGGGVVGLNALRVAVGMEAQVTVIDRSLPRLRELDLCFGSRIHTVYSTQDALEHYVQSADLVIGAVLIPGAAAPKLVTRSMLAQMKPGSVVVDVAIDQGGCFETSHVTTHSEPTYMVDQVVHYCVGNMPGAVPRTASCALNNATLPFVLALANQGVKSALAADAHLRNGLNIHAGHLTYAAVAEHLGLNFLSPEKALVL